MAIFHQGNLDNLGGNLKNVLSWIIHGVCHEDTKDEIWSDGMMGNIQHSNTPILQKNSFSYFVPSCLRGYDL
jgi:hypothetical protein